MRTPVVPVEAKLSPRALTPIRPHPLATAYACTRLVFHQHSARVHSLWPAAVWLRLAHRFGIDIRSESAAAPPAKMQPNYRLIAIPQQLYAHLTADQFLRSDHYVIVAPSTHDQLIDVKTQHWRNLVFITDDTDSKHVINARTVTQAILKRPNASALVAVLPAAANTPLDSDAIYVSENFFRNCVAKFKLDRHHRDQSPAAHDDHHDVQLPIAVQLQELQSAQRAPQLSTKATVFTVNQPHEVGNDIIDEILACFFRTPRILCRNYTYGIVLDAQLLGLPTWVRHLQLFHHMRTLHFRCVHLESADNAFELCAVVVKGRTSLQQTTSINMPLPARRLHALCPGVSAYPAGLRAYFEALRASVLPFLGAMAALSSTADAAASATDLTAVAMTSQSALTSMPMILLQGPRGAGKTTVLHSVAAALGIQVLTVDCAEIVSQIAAQTEAKLKVALARARQCQPLIVALTNFELFGVDADGREDQRAINMFEAELAQFFAGGGLPVIVIAVSNETDTKPLLRRLFLDAVQIDALDKTQRADALNWLHTVGQITDAVYAHQRLSTVPLCGTGDDAVAAVARFNDAAELLADIAERTPGFLYGDVRLLYGNSVNRARSQRLVRLDASVFEYNLQQMQALFADSLGAPKVPKVLWSDIGGLAKLKEEIQTSIGLPLRHLHLMGKNLRRSGILLYGPPGTGKTLVAKAVATECNLSFLSVQGPELLNMYVGQSEQNVREVFARARSAAPCVVFLDELDSLAPNRGMAGDSGGVMDRVVSQLMTEMNGMSDGKGLISGIICCRTVYMSLMDLCRSRSNEAAVHFGGYKSTGSDRSVIAATGTLRQAPLCRAVHDHR